MNFNFEISLVGCMLFTINTCHGKLTAYDIVTGSKKMLLVIAFAFYLTEIPKCFAVQSS